MTIKSLQSTSLTNNIFYRSMLAGNEPFGLSSYWISLLGGSSSEYGEAVAVDSLGNIYGFGATNSTGTGSDDAFLVKYDTDGVVQWQRTLGGTSSDIGYSVDVDSAYNVYVAGFTANQGSGNYEFLLAKYNSSGTIQWQRTIGGGVGGGDNSVAQAVAIDSSDNVYVLGYTAVAGLGSQTLLLAKYNSSGVFQWQRILGGTSRDQGYEVAIDSSDNVYVAGFTENAGAGQRDFLLAKYNPAGTIQWQRTLGGSAWDYANSVAIDSSNNVYIFGYTENAGAGVYDLLLAKYNSSGALQWQRTLGTTDYDQGYAVAIDSSDNVYVNGYASAGQGSRDFIIAKYNSSGTLQWQRTLGGSAYDVGNSIAIDPSDNILAFGLTASAGRGYEFLLAKLPNDGSLTGTYVLNSTNFVYAASSLTGATSSLTSGTSSLNASTSSLPSGALSLTDAGASLTSYLVEL